MAVREIIGLDEFSILTIRERSDPKEDVTRLNIEIELLKKEVERTDEEILRLNQDVEFLREENRNVTASLNSKNKEISGLKLEIKKLRTQKEELENRVWLLQAEVGTLNKEVANLKEENGRLQDDKLALEERVDALSSAVTDMKETSQSNKVENARLSKKVNDLIYRLSKEREVHESRHSAVIESPTSDNTKRYASLILGELCRQIQSLMYQKVFPMSYDSKESYKVKYIEEDIENLEDEKERKTAAETWDNLQKELEWDSKLFTRTMKSIQEQMNVAAHPKLNHNLLLQSAKLLNGDIYGPKTFENIKKLIGTWKKLVQMQ